jgi:hypothetical protein
MPQAREVKEEDHAYLKQIVDRFKRHKAEVKAEAPPPRPHKNNQLYQDLTMIGIPASSSAISFRRSEK